MPFAETVSSETVEPPRSHTVGVGKAQPLPYIVGYWPGRIGNVKNVANSRREQRRSTRENDSYGERPTASSRELVAHSGDEVSDRNLP